MRSTLPLVFRARRAALIALWLPGLVLGCGPRPGGESAPATPSPSASATPAPSPTPERFGLGSYSWPVTTSSDEAQRAFDRGLTLAFAFNHGAAEREFRRAAELDRQCAMAWWGVALVNGPHINNPVVTPDQARVAWEALERARQLVAGASPIERALIDALGTRHAAVPAEDRRPLDEAYATAMRALWRAEPEDADIAALFAEAMMDLRPWDLWTEAGKPQPGTEEILAALERAMELDPEHPLANHLYIHACEGSPDPGRATAAADRLRDLVPGAGHLVHMPAHIDVRTGRWADAAAANERAILADAAFRAAAPVPGFYNIYMAHNRHFLAFVSMMEGRSGVALQAAREMVAGVPPDFLREAAFFADGLMPIPIEVLMRFGKWDEVLAEPEPPEYLPVSRAIRLFARAAALNALGRLDEAATERASFRAAVKALPEDRVIGNNPAHAVLAIASLVLDGEMAAKRGSFDEAVRALRQAAKAEDALRYDEPPDWIQPVRHTLGAVLLGAGRHAEAEAAYREDLARFPENGWSLLGLGRALRLQKKDEEAVAVEARFARAWSRADVKIAATCLCQPPV